MREAPVDAGACVRLAMGSAARPGGRQMLQPTGPQEPPWEWPPPPPPPYAAGADIRRPTCLDLQAGQATSASSDFRTINSSKLLPQSWQAYS